MGFQAIRLHFVANACRARVLPDDGIVDGFARYLVPNDCRLTLVGDAEIGRAHV